MTMTPTIMMMTKMIETKSENVERRQSTLKTKLAVLQGTEAITQTTFCFHFSTTGAIPFCVKITVTATILTAADKGIR